MLMALGLLPSAAGCAEKAVELRLVMPTGEIANTDLSCVNSVHVILHTGSLDFQNLPSQCIEVTSPSSYADLEEQIRGKFSMGLPADIVAVEIRGQANAIAGSCGTGMNVFYAGANYTEADQIELRVEGSMDCSAMTGTGTVKVRPIDFLALAKTPAGSDPVCTTLAGVQGIDMGVIRPTNIALDNFPTSVIEWGDTAEPDATTGLAELPAWGTPLPTTCLASSESFDMFSASCIYPSNKQICAGAGEVEVPLLTDLNSYDSIDNDIIGDYPVMVYGVVYDSATRRPVAGAKVQLGEDRGVVVYTKPTTTTRMEPLDGDVTDASGGFIAYLREPSVATVTQGASTKSMRIGGVTGWGSAVIVPLR